MRSTMTVGLTNVSREQTWPESRLSRNLWSEVSFKRKLRRKLFGPSADIISCVTLWVEILCDNLCDNGRVGLVSVVLSIKRNV